MGGEGGSWQMTNTHYYPRDEWKKRVQGTKVKTISTVISTFLHCVIGRCSFMSCCSGQRWKNCVLHHWIMINDAL